MPYAIHKDSTSKSGRVKVVLKATGKVVARPVSHARAVKMIQAIYANEHKK